MAVTPSVSSAAAFLPSLLQWKSMRSDIWKTSQYLGVIHPFLHFSPLKLFSASLSSVQQDAIHLLYLDFIPQLLGDDDLITECFSFSFTDFWYNLGLNT